MNPFDRLLADRVRRAFDAYQEEPDAAAFAALTEKLRAQDPKSSSIAGRIFTIGIPLAAAASVMLAVGLTIWRATSVPTPIGVEPQAQVYAETPAVHSTPVAIPAVSQPPAIIQPRTPPPISSSVFPNRRPNRKAVVRCRLKRAPVSTKRHPLRCSDPRIPSGCPTRYARHLRIDAGLGIGGSNGWLEPCRRGRRIRWRMGSDIPPAWLAMWRPDKVSAYRLAHW